LQHTSLASTIHVLRCFCDGFLLHVAEGVGFGFRVWLCGCWWWVGGLLIVRKTELVCADIDGVESSGEGMASAVNSRNRGNKLFK
jgi:hypothetical protein